MKQDKSAPVPVGCQVAIIYAAINNFLIDIPLANIKQYEKELYSYLGMHHDKLLDRFADGFYEDSDKKELEEALTEFTNKFISTTGLN